MYNLILTEHSFDFLSLYSMEVDELVSITREGSCEELCLFNRMKE